MKIHMYARQIAVLCTMFLHLHYILHYTRTLIMAKDTMFSTNRWRHTYKYLEKTEESVFRNGMTSTNVYQMSINSKDIKTWKLYFLSASSTIPEWSLQMTQDFLYHSGKKARLVHIIVASEFGNFKLLCNLLQWQILFTPFETSIIP